MSNALGTLTKQSDNRLNINNNFVILAGACPEGRPGVALPKKPVAPCLKVAASHVARQTIKTVYVFLYFF